MYSTPDIIDVVITVCQLRVQLSSLAIFSNWTIRCKVMVMNRIHGRQNRKYGGVYWTVADACLFEAVLNVVPDLNL